MDQKDINHAIKKRRLRLSPDRILTHFSWVLSLEISSIYIAINMYSKNTNSIIYLVSLIISFLSLCFIYFKWTQLSFTVFKVDTTRKELYLSIVKLCETKGWNFKVQRFKTSALNPNDFEGGEISTYSDIYSDAQLIRIILIDNSLYINCMADYWGNQFKGKWNSEKIFQELISEDYINNGRPTPQ